MSFIKNKNSSDYTITTRSVYKLLSKNLGYTARISDIWHLLLMAYGLEEFEILDPRYYQNGAFEAYLMDCQFKWQHGEDLDLEEVSKVILSTGDFTESEKLLMGSGDMCSRLWAIFLCICDPTLTI